MTIEKAIKDTEEILALKKNGAFCGMPGEDDTYFETVLSALRAQQVAGKNEPLTEAELAQMVGQPIWIMPTANAPDRLDWDPAWVIMREDYVFVYSKSHESRAYIRFVKDYGKTWIAYRNPPEGDDSL